VLDSSLQPLIGSRRGRDPVAELAQHLFRDAQSKREGLANAALWTPWDLDAGISTTRAGTGFPPLSAMSAAPFRTGDARFIAGSSRSFWTGSMWKSLEPLRVGHRGGDRGSIMRIDCQAEARPL